MTTLTILVTVDKSGRTHCTPILDKNSVEVVWKLGTQGWEFDVDKPFGLPPDLFSEPVLDPRDGNMKSKFKRPSGSAVTDHEYTISVKPISVKPIKDPLHGKATGTAIIRNDPTAP